jgi:hypothetical protein
MFGPAPIPIVPRSDFSKSRLTTEQCRDLWRIVGPSAAMNLDRAPLWKVIVMAYFEGLMHGAGIEAERHTIQRLKAEETSDERFTV